MAAARSGQHPAASNTSSAETFAEFLDLAGHDLRSPITALSGQLQLMRRHLRRQDDRASDLSDVDKMMYQIERLNVGLAVFLDASRLMRKRFQLFVVECDLIALAQRVVGLYAAGCPGYNITFTYDEDQVIGNYDRVRVDMLLSILLANAVRFGTGGHIEVRLTRAGERVRVEVSDRGIGVPAADRFRIFEPYQHASNIQHAGVGLGLYVARETARRHHGRIGVRARKGGGSTFWFTLASANDTTVPMNGQPAAATPVQQHHVSHVSHVSHAS